MVGAERHRYVVALDFGTTYTGISHVNATKKTLDDIQIIKNWPGPSKEFIEVVKTPSKLAYRSENPQALNICEDAAEVIWGYDVEPGMVCYSWMKLRLDERTEITEHDDSSLAGLADSQGKGLLQLPRGKSAVQVCTDYLTGVYNYTMQELNRTWGDSIVRATPIDWWVTCPATWSDRAKHLTKTAALSAGFSSRNGDRMFLITEPEAAAVATLTGLIGEGMENQIKPGDGILVCDCGGGTVDINTYRIKSTSPSLDFEELAVGEGGKVGSTFIDRQFHEWMGARFGVDFYNLDFKKKGPGSRFMKEFEAIKRDFGESRNSQQEFRIPLKIKNACDSKFYDEDENMIIITKDDLKSFFDPSVMKIKQLLKAQLDKANHEMERTKTVGTIILVGGMGSSKYLFHSLQAWCQANRGLRLLCPPNPQAAIVKGAALRGLGNIKPSRRRARHHYGFMVSQPFREGEDPECLSYIDLWSNTKCCSNVLSWQINRGDYVNEQTKIAHRLRRTWYVGTPKTGSINLYVSSLDGPAKYGHDGGYQLVGVLNFSFELLNMSMFPTKMINACRAYKISYGVEIHMGDKTGSLVFKVVSEGEEIGKASLDFSQIENMTFGLGERAYT